MGFFRKEVIDFALDEQTRRAVEEQTALIAQDPANPRPYYQLALLYCLEQRQDDALGLLLESIRLDPAFSPAHVALAEIYTVRNDTESARRHAGIAAAHGDLRAQKLLERYASE